MNIVDTFRKHFCTNTNIDNDFLLIKCSGNILIGLDRQSRVSVVVKSNKPNRHPIVQKTQNMSIECNISVLYTLNGENIRETVHILRCLSREEYEKELFLELATVFINNSDGSEESLLEIFSTLRTFFSNRTEITDNELIGLFAELYTICYYHESLNIEKFWQSRDRMKFDFSISDKLKLEVKATTKNSRTHHFRHEQLMTDLYDIYILSYLLRYDDEGISVYEIIMQSKLYLKNDPRKLLKINHVLKNVSKERLENMRFNREYIEVNSHIYKAVDIPKFDEITPDGVLNAEYDCVLDNVVYSCKEEFIGIVNSEIDKNIINYKGD